MKDKIMKFLGAAVGLAVLAASVLSPVSVLAEAQNKFPAEAGGYKHQNLVFQGAKVKRVTKSATATLLVSGEGFLDGFCAFGGTMGDYSMAFDTTSSAQTEAASTGGSTDADASWAYRLGPQLHTYVGPVTDTSSSGANRGCWFPPFPIKFVTGLYGDANGAHSTDYYVHCSDGDNPCAL